VVVVVAAKVAAVTAARVVRASSADQPDR
jgi:hypothetical protein